MTLSDATTRNSYGTSRSSSTIVQTREQRQSPSPELDQSILVNTISTYFVDHSKHQYDFTSFYENEEMTDVTLYFNSTNQKLKCHRLILSVASPMFKTMFSSGMLESQYKVIELEDEDYDTMRMVCCVLLVVCLLMLTTCLDHQIYLFKKDTIE
jgi:hypothetical protein